MDEYTGMIKLFAGNFAPENWAFCSGQLLSIAQFQALFSLLGTTYGGDGMTTFSLPDLRGRTPLCFGQGPGLEDYPQGAPGGEETVTLLAAQLPAHTHLLSASATNGNAVPPTNGLLAESNGTASSGDSLTGNAYLPDAAADTPLNAASIGVGGGSQAHDNRPPYLALNYIICLDGLYPSRS